MKVKYRPGPAGENRLDQVVEKLVSGEMIHSTPLSAGEAKELGLPVNTDFPEDVHEFMKLFRPVKRSVQLWNKFDLKNFRGIGVFNLFF